MARFNTVLLFGGPGTGKSTQGKILATIPGFHHCASGDLFRNIDAHSELGRIFHEYSSRGELVPDDVTVRIWAEAMDKTTSTRRYQPTRDLLILDGIPRTLKQAQILDQHVAVLRLIHLTCNDEPAMFERLRYRALKENRHDDADENVIRNRWTVYGQQTAPLLSYYPTEAIAKVDAIGSPARIIRDILNILLPILDAHFTAFAG